MDTLPVNEIFLSIQGEATHAGKPSVFIRLQGCPVGCPWCDSRATWYVDQEKEVAALELQLKTESGVETWANVSIARILTMVMAHPAKHVVITGGEPCLHDLTLLTTALLGEGRTVQIETSGTQPILCDERTWVTVSPKVGMPGGFMVRPDGLARADEIKMPIGKPADLQVLFDLLRSSPLHDSDVPVWLQPLSTSPKATDLCRVAAIANGFRVSLQLHAYAGWR